jgi:fibronectin-binding autotransporter adhesin
MAFDRTSRPKVRLRTALISAAVAAASCTTLRSASAQTSGSWYVDGSGSWSVASNWTPATPGAGGVATFSTFSWLSSTPTVTQDLPNVTLSGIVFDSPFLYTIARQGTLPTITLAGPATISVTNPTPAAPSMALMTSQVGHRIDVPLIGTNGLVKSGPGLLTLTSANLYTGSTVISGGVLSIAGDAALGAAANDVILNGGGLRVSATNFSTRGIALNASAGTIDVAGFGAATFTGVISGGGDLVKSMTGGMALGVSNTYTGATRINAGSLILDHLGSITSSSSIMAGGTLALDSSINPLNDRIGDSVPVTFRGSGLTFTGGALGSSEKIGAASFSGGVTFVTITPNAAANASVTADSLNRADRGTIFLRGTNLGAAPSAGVGNAYFVAPPALFGGGGAAGSTTISILPYAWGATASTSTSSASSNSLVTYGANGIRPLNVTTEYASSIVSGSVSSNNVRLTADQPVTAPSTVNAVVLATAGGLSGAGTLTIGSGALLNLAGIGAISCPIDFGSAEGLLLMPAAGTFATSSAISGSGGLTKSGNGVATLLSTNSTYTGQTSIVGGRIAYVGNVGSGAATGVLGMDTSPILLAPGVGGRAELFAAAAGTSTFDRGLLVRGNPAGTCAIGSTGAFSDQVVVMNGAIQLDNTLTFAATASPAMQINGAITGTGGITDTTSSAQALSGNNTFTGGTEIHDGAYGVASDTALGTGTIWFASTSASPKGTLFAAGGPHTIANPIVLLASPTIGGSEDLTLTGAMNLGGAPNFVHTIANTALTTYAGKLFGGAVDKGGNGTLVLSASNTYSGRTRVSGGVLRVANPSALGTVQSPTVVEAGAALELAAGVKTNETLQLNGAGVASGGALRSLGGATSVGPITLLSTTSIAVDSGTLSSGNIGLAQLNSSLTKSGAGVLSAGRYRARSLDVDGGTAAVSSARITTATSTLTGLSIVPGAALDLGANDLVIDYGSQSSSPLPSVQAWLTTGFAGGAWTGPGITSAAAAAVAATTGGPKTALGSAESSDLFGGGSGTFSGQSVDGNAVLVRYTAYGDANLDGNVNTTDFNLVAANFGATSGARWFHGDFNYDGAVSTTDFNLLASNFGASVATPEGTEPQEGAGALGALVPEPTSLALVGCSMVALFHRRRRRDRRAAGSCSRVVERTIRCPKHQDSH